MKQSPSQHFMNAQHIKIKKIPIIKCKVFGHDLVNVTEYDDYNKKMYSLCQRCQRHIVI